MIRLGIVGAGWILSAHLAGLAELVAAGVDVKLTAMASRNRNSLLPLLEEEVNWSDAFRARPTAMDHVSVRSFQPEVDVAIFDDHRALIASGLVDAILDLTPPSLHHVVGADALEAGLHVLTEKPLGISVRAATLLVESARRNNRVLAVAETVRCMSEVQIERKFIAADLLGELRHVSWSNMGGAWAPDLVVASTPWRHDRRLAGGGTTLDNGVHHVDWLRYTVGEIVTVSARAIVAEPVRRIAETGRSITADTDDMVEATLAFGNGVIGNLALSWATAGAGAAVPTYRGSTGSMSGGILLDALGSAPASTAHQLKSDNRFASPFTEQLARWLRAIDGDGEPAVSGEEGLRDVSVCMAMLESSLAGAWIDVDDVASGRLRRYQEDIDNFHGLV